MPVQACGHEACGCAVTDESEFCSQHCEQAAEAADEEETEAHGPCACGHAECAR